MVKVRAAWPMTLRTAEWGHSQKFEVEHVDDGAKVFRSY